MLRSKRVMKSQVGEHSVTAILSGRTRASSHVARQLRDDINSGRRPPGEPLGQELLAAEYEVSRIPIRDALSILESEGLVRVGANRRAYITSFTRQQIAEIFDLRILLELELLKHVIHAHTPTTLRALTEIQRQLELTQIETQWVTLDQEFHCALYEPANRRQSLSMLNMLERPLARFGLSSTLRQIHCGDWATQHWMMIQFVARRDLKSASSMLRDHLVSHQQLVIRSMEESA